MSIKVQEHRVADPMPALHGHHDTAHLKHGHRGHPGGAVVDGKTVRAPAAADIQPRHGRPKFRYDSTLPHGGMTNSQRAGMGQGGMGHATAVVDGGQTIVSSAAAAPLQHAYGVGADGAVPHSKLRGPVPVYPGMRSRTNSSHPNDQSVAKGLNGHLPQVVSSKT
jgi:hypothetical protein